MTEIIDGRIVESEIELTAEDVATIEKSDKEIDEGKGVDSREVAKRMQKKYGIKYPKKER